MWRSPVGVDMIPDFVPEPELLLDVAFGRFGVGMLVNGRLRRVSG